MLQLRLLGQFDVRAGGKRIVIPTRAGQCLLAFLALNPGIEHRRERLAGLVWADISDENARRSLRTELWRLRKLLSTDRPLSVPESPRTEYFITSDIAIMFNPDADYWLDAAQLTRPELDSSTSPGPSLEALISSVSVYRGELLPGFYEDWVNLERERLQAVFESKMQLLLERLVGEERWATTQEWAEKWLGFGTAPEPAYRALMLAYGARGDMAKVATIYQRCEEDLHDQLGVEPSAETRALYEGLLKGGRAPLRTPGVHPFGTVTFLFTDIEGSTGLLDALGEDYAVVLADQRDLLRAAIQKWNGHEEDTQGDAFFVSFSRAIDAVQCAVEAQRALNAHLWPQGARVRVRMGLHTGEPLIASTGYIGMDVHRAARIGDAGHGGQVLLSQTTRELVIHDLPHDVTIRELGEYRLKDLKYPTPIFQLVVEGLQNDFLPLKTKFTGTEPPTQGEPPFKGLQYFDVADADLFFGREHVTQKLVNRLRESRFLSVIIGASGSGKSSVVRAGLIPGLKQGNEGTDGTKGNLGTWRVYVMTPTAHPLEALATELTRESESVTATATLLDDLTRDPRALHLWLRRRTNAEGRMMPHHSSLILHPLLVVDQFEELFTLCRDEFERVAFIDNLLSALPPLSDAQGNFTLVITLRADFYAHLAQYPELRDAVAQQQEYIGPMNAEELRRAIEEPAKRGQWEFEPGLVDLILRDVGDEPGALPLLSHALLETWKHRAGHTLTLKGYHDAGGVRGAIAYTAETTYQELNVEAQETARRILLRLTELGEGTEDTRRRASFDELLSDAEDAAQVRAVLNLLADARLITLGEEIAEVAHEALIREWGRLREWLNQDREGLRLHRQLTEAAREWQFMEHDTGTLFRGARLIQICEWAAANPKALNSQERAFLTASLENERNEEREKEEARQRELLTKEQLLEAEQRRVEQEQASNQRLRRRAVFLAGAFLLAALLAGIALLLGDQARTNAMTAQEKAQEAQVQQRVANSRALAANALNNLNIDPQRSILLALAAVQATEPDRNTLPEAQDALHRAIIASHVEAILPQGQATLSARYTPDGSRLVTRGASEIQIWDVNTREKILTIPLSSGFYLLNNLGINTDGSQVATLDHAAGGNSPNPMVKVFDASTGKLLREIVLEHAWSSLMGVGFSPDLGRVTLTDWGETPIQVWDTLRGEKLLSLPIAGGFFVRSNAAFSPDGKRIVTATFDPAAKVFDAATGEELMTLCCHVNALDRAVYSPDGKWIATSGEDAKVKIWDAQTGSLLNTLSSHTYYVVNIGWSPDSKRLASAGWDRKAMVWDAESGKKIYELPGHTDLVHDAAFSPDGKKLITVGDDKTAMLWDVGPSREVGAIEGPPQIQRAEHSADRTVFAAHMTGKEVKLWDTEKGELRLTFSDPSNDWAVAFALSPDSRLVAYRASDGNIYLSDIQSGKRQVLAKATSYPRDPQFSPDGSRVAAPYDIDKGAAGVEAHLNIWETSSGLVLANILLGLKSDTWSNFVTWSPDAKRLVVGYGNGAVEVWDAAIGKKLLDLPGHTNMVTDIVYSPDGTKFATASEDGTIIMREAAQGVELLRLVGHTGAIKNVDFSPDGNQIVTASADGTAKVWDAATGREFVTFYHSPDAVTGAMFTADGKHILTSSEDGAIREFTLDMDELVALAKARLIRTWRTEECQKFLQLEQCPQTK